MSARNQQTAVGCPSCGSIREEPARRATVGSLVCVPDLRHTADHDPADIIELRLMSA